jgi:hypothetical protein
MLVGTLRFTIQIEHVFSGGASIAGLSAKVSVPSDSDPLSSVVASACA